jgi:DNA-binding NtrC family response regulator
VSALRGALTEAGRFGRMIGRSDAMRSVYDLITRVAVTAAPVLLTGESGTGKEVAAATIHDMSPRRGRPFVAINCGAISASLIESHLFGHEKGAFTGAEEQRQGVFEQADGGTLFLDEIGEMPKDLQVRLLRVLEERRVRRVGGDRDIPVDVRIIAATNRDPSKAMSEGRLRDDLYHRLNVFPIALPPLSGRRGDAPLLAEHFLQALNAEAQAAKRFGPGVIEAVERAPWPGNVRELRNWVQRAWIMADDVIEADTLAGPPTATATRPPADAGTGADEIRIPIGVSMEEAERRIVLKTLAHCGGNKRKTARTLGMSVKTLYARLARYEARATPGRD